jgi:hypothetical protein
VRANHEDKQAINHTGKARFRRTSSSAAATACFDELCSFQFVLDRLKNDIFSLAPKLGGIHAHLTRDRKTTVRATLFKLRPFLRGGGRATGKPMRAIEAKIVRSLEPNRSVMEIWRFIR